MQHPSNYIGIILGLSCCSVRVCIGFIMGLYCGYTGVVLRLYWGYIGITLGLHWDKGKENGNYYLGFRV